MVVAPFVSDLLLLFAKVLQSITITKQEKYGDYSVCIVIDTQWEDTVKSLALKYCLTQQTIFSEKNTQAG